MKSQILGIKPTTGKHKQNNTYLSSSSQENLSEDTSDVETEGVLHFFLLLSTYV